MEEQYYSAALVWCGAGAGISGISGLIRFHFSQLLYLKYILEIFHFFSCNHMLFNAQVVESADQRGAVLSIVIWLSS